MVHFKQLSKSDLHGHLSLRPTAVDQEWNLFSTALLACLESVYSLNDRMQKIWETFWLFCDNYVTNHL